jgi:uncharacterized membrane protein YfcA
MPTDWTLPLVLGVLFAATLVRSTFGFGEALVSVPLLALWMPVEIAAPVAALVSITVAALVVARDWRQIHFRGASWLVLATLPGIPLGLWLLVGVAEPVVKAILAVVILAFSLYSLVRPGRATLGDDRWAGLFGFVAGVLGGAYGMNGPPLVMFGTLRGWTPERFRATLQGYFLPASAIVMTGYALAGLWTSAVSRYYLLSLPGVLAAILLGRAINRRLSAERFARYVHLALIAIGALLLAQAAG